MNFITTYCHISEDHCAVNGEVLLTNESENSWIRTLYDHFKIDYSKFHKMDLMSKIGVIGSEILKSQNGKIVDYDDDEIALVFANKNSSANTDVKFQQSFKENGSPSPALFVYTLPNIVLGEIAIKNKWYGENIFVVSENFDPEFYENYCNILIPSKAMACACGWVNVLNDSIEAFFFFVEKEASTEDSLPLTSNNLLNLRKA